jgi:Zinc carboxypeptidase
MSNPADTHPTPFERGGGHQTTTLNDCHAFYARLEADFPHALKLTTIGHSDAGLPIVAGVITSDGVFDREALQAQARPIFFNNNGIHPGEPEGIDVCMALVRDLCASDARRQALGRTVFLFVAIYNVDGAWARNSASRVDQAGPEAYGFRGNAMHLDLNRDFIKCDSSAALAFNRFFAAWQPDVMVDTHTSNGADYPYTMTLIATQPDKLGGALGAYLRDTMLPALYSGMQRAGWPTCPYVNTVHTTPDQGIEDFLETPRFSTGYAALHDCIGFMPETHMLKPFADRHAAMRALVDTVLGFTVAQGDQIRALRRQARQQHSAGRAQALRWAIDRERVSALEFEGYAAVREPSRIGRYERLRYDRKQLWRKTIDHFHHAKVIDEATVPKAYVVPQAWRAVIERLQANGVVMRRLPHDEVLTAEVYRIESVQSRPQAYEGHLFHDEVQLSTHVEAVPVRAGDVLLPMDASQTAARYAFETLEPLAHDSFFRWGFFNSVLERKEPFSDYAFEDTAWAMLQQEPILRAAFDTWAQQHPEQLEDSNAVLSFILRQGQRHAEPGWRRYPVLRLLS